MKHDIDLNLNFTIQRYFGLSMYVLIYINENIFFLLFDSTSLVFFHT